MPRSPSRNLSDRYDGNRAYFHRSEVLRRGRYLLAIAALVMVFGWVIADVLVPKRLAYTHTHGPLANPHAAWDNDCAACHRGYSAGDFKVSAAVKPRDRWRDLTCEKCHAGPVHHANLDSSGQAFHKRCENCHHDHKGRLNSLVRIADSHCTRCHANLSEHHLTGDLKSVAKVTDFVADHPEFAPLSAPPNRTLKFSHAVHMTPGQSYAPGGKEAITVGKLRALAGDAAAERYRKPGQSDQDLVSLGCASCHQLDAGVGTAHYDSLKTALNAAAEPSGAILSPRASGANHLAVNFEAHCRACHPLRAGEGASGKAVVAGFDVPHRQQLDALREAVAAGYVQKIIAENRLPLAVPAGPGGLLEPKPEVAARALREEIDRLTNAAMKKFQTGDGGCAKCHDIADSRITPVKNRTVWLRKANFDHAAHKASTCSTCHPGTLGAFVAPRTSLVEKEPVQILGIDSCRACHSPTGTKIVRSEETALVGGGVRHGCTDCHRYHNADHGLQGRGAPALFPSRPLDLAEFFRRK